MLLYTDLKTRENDCFYLFHCQWIQHERPLGLLPVDSVKSQYLFFLFLFLIAGDKWKNREFTQIKYISNLVKERKVQRIMDLRLAFET